MNTLRKDLLCPCCNGTGVQDKHACQAFKKPYMSGNVHQCSLEGRYDLDGVHYCGIHLKKELKKQNRLDEFEALTVTKEKLVSAYLQFLRNQHGQGISSKAISSSQ
jgi:hypothetical protein